MNYKWLSIWALPDERAKWGETVFITAAFLAAGYFFNNHDPFFTRSAFPWFWFAPLLVSLRYGMAPGVVSVSAITLLMLMMIRAGLLPYTFSSHHILGGLLLTMICGQFTTVWQKRLKRAERLSEHAVERAQQVSRAYFMVRLSHDRLEQNLISKPVTLRQAMVDLRLLLVRHAGAINGKVASELLAILSHYCNLDSASIYAVTDGRLSADLVASCGKGAPCDPEDILVGSAMESGNTVYQSVDRMQPGLRSSYLVVSPMRSSSGDLMAVLLVSEMPFMALQRENLQIMGVLLSYCVEHAFAAKKAAEILDVYPDCPPTFASELIKMHGLNKELGIDSTLAMLHVHPNPREKEMALSIEQKQRGLDHVWSKKTPAGSVLITLMPFSGVSGGEGYTARINEFLMDRFGMELGTGTVSSCMMQVVATVPPVEHLSGLLRLEGIDEGI